MRWRSRRLMENLMVITNVATKLAKAFSLVSLPQNSWGSEITLWSRSVNALFEQWNWQRTTHFETPQKHGSRAMPKSGIVKQRYPYSQVDRIPNRNSSCQRWVCFRPNRAYATTPFRADKSYYYLHILSNAKKYMGLTSRYWNNGPTQSHLILSLSIEPHVCGPT